MLVRSASLSAWVLRKRCSARVTCRPADLLQPEMARLREELRSIARERNLTLAEREIEDVLTYALFPQAGLQFLENRGKTSAFEAVP